MPFVRPARPQRHNTEGSGFHPSATVLGEAGGGDAEGGDAEGGDAEGGEADGRGSRREGQREQPAGTRPVREGGRSVRAAGPWAGLAGARPTCGGAAGSWAQPPCGGAAGPWARVEAGDDITLVRRGPGEPGVADADALLYLPGRDPAKLRTALRVPDLSPGWQQSFRGLAAAGQPGPEPGAPGFRPMRVARIFPETADVSSVPVCTTDGTALPGGRPGQYRSPRADAVSRRRVSGRRAWTGSPSLRPVRRRRSGPATSYLSSSRRSSDHGAGFPPPRRSRGRSALPERLVSAPAGSGTSPLGI